MLSCHGCETSWMSLGLSKVLMCRCHLFTDNQGDTAYASLTAGFIFNHSLALACILSIACCIKGGMACSGWVGGSLVSLSTCIGRGNSLFPPPALSLPGKHLWETVAIVMSLLFQAQCCISGGYCDGEPSWPVTDLDM